jgi:hypothetical protein
MKLANPSRLVSHGRPATRKTKSPTRTFGGGLEALETRSMLSAALPAAVTRAVPVAPSEIAANNVWSNMVDVAWRDNSSNESRFVLQRHRDGANWADVGAVPANTRVLRDTGLAADTRYYYRVAAENGSGRSAYSSTLTLTTAPAAPTNLVAANVWSDTVDLSWRDMSDSEAGFRVQVDNNGAWTDVLTTAANDTTCRVTGLRGETGYTFRVRSFNRNGTSGVAETLALTTAPPPPLNVNAVSVNSTTADVTWTDASATEAGFFVQVARDDGRWLTVATTGPGATACRVTSLAPRTHYTVRVRSFSASGSSGVANTVELNQPAAWTYLVYVDADNSLEPEALEDFQEMARVGSGDALNIVVQMDRAPGLTADEGNWTDARRGLVQRGDHPDTSWGRSIGETNTGDPDTLARFVNWGAHSFPADHYALVLWDHGSGIDGTCFDDTNNDYLTMADVGNALRATDVHLDVMACDACEMGMVECAHEVADRADYMVASEELEPAAGFPYHTILADLQANPGWNGAQLGAAIVNRYAQAYAGSDAFEPETMSCVNVHQVVQPGSGLSAAMSNLADAILTAATPQDRIYLSFAHDASMYYGGVFTDGSFRDVGMFLDGIVSQSRMSPAIRSAAAAARTALNQSVVANWSRSGQSTGLAIYLQQAGEGVRDDYNASHFAFARDTHWDELAQVWSTFPPILGGDANLDGAVDVSDLIIVAQHYNQSGTTWAQGDFDFDGHTDFYDLVILTWNFGAVSRTATAAPAPVQHTATPQQRTEQRGSSSRTPGQRPAATRRPAASRDLFNATARIRRT